MTEPEELAAAITTHLKNALEEIEALTDELAPDVLEKAI
jgi:type I restriction enzyme M protein